MHNFITNSLSSSTIKDAYLRATEYVLQQMNEKTNIKTMSDLKKYLGEGPKILPSILDDLKE